MKHYSWVDTQATPIYFTDSVLTDCCTRSPYNWCTINSREFQVEDKVALWEAGKNLWEGVCRHNIPKMENGKRACALLPISVYSSSSWQREDTSSLALRHPGMPSAVLLFCQTGASSSYLLFAFPTAYAYAWYHRHNTWPSHPSAERRATPEQ